MCGRFAFTKSREEIKKRLRLKTVPKEYTPRYNIAPSQNIPAVLNDLPDSLSLVRWGLIPHWAKEEKIGYKMINARAETIAEKTSYRGPVQKRRCLIPSDSFFEWKKTGNKKVPYRVMLEDEAVFCMAGIWDVWSDGIKEIKSCSIITVPASEFMRGLHERMPVILPREAEAEWLDDINVSRALDMLKPFSSDKMVAYPVSSMVNFPENDVPQVLEKNA